MKREIKFRIWDGDSLTEIGGYFWEEEGVSDFDLANLPNGLVLMQYTGLKDKNGIEIYEGDIVRYLTVYGGTKLVRTIKWRESIHSVGWNIGGSTENFEVIGNIYDR